MAMRGFQNLRMRSFGASSVLLSFLFVCVLCACCFSSSPAHAEEDEVITAEAITHRVSLTESQQDKLSSSETRFAGYVDSLFAQESDRPVFGNYGEQLFEGGALSIYHALKSMCADVAQGETASTSFSIDYGDWGSSTTLSAQEFDGQMVVNGSINPKAVDALVAKTLGGSTFPTIVECLLDDCPYVLYWFDKTVGYSYSLGGCSYNYRTQLLSWNSGASCDMYVEEAYSRSGEADTLFTNTKKTSKTKIAVNNALAIVAANEGKSDYQKLLAYKDTICEMTYYDYSAVYNSNTPYGDPWQLISVFDNDPSTKVVCEGYAKAFQFLCDKSNFGSDCTACITVTGTLDGGGHMWNNVVMNDTAYLVDVTNCDTGSVGYPGYLFLAGSPGSVLGGYTFEMPDGQKIKYKYDNATTSLYGASAAGLSLLDIAHANYVPITVSVTGLSKPLTYGYTSASKLKVKAKVDSSLKGGELHYQWYMAKPGKSFTAIKGATSSSCTVPRGLAVGTYQFYCEVSLVKSDKVVGSKFSPKTSVRVKSAPISKVSGLSVKLDNPTYSGGSLKPACVIMAGKSKLVKGKDYSVSFQNNIGVGKAKAVITGKGNYTGSMSKTFKILPKGTKIKGITAAGNGFVVRWVPQKSKMGAVRVDGYQVRYSTKSNMKSCGKKIMRGYRSSKGIVTKLKANKKYYVQVRTFAKVNGKIYYSAWSKSKGVVTA